MRELYTFHLTSTAVQRIVPFACKRHSTLNAIFSKLSNVSKVPFLLDAFTYTISTRKVHRVAIISTIKCGIYCNRRINRVVLQWRSLSWLNHIQGVSLHQHFGKKSYQDFCQKAGTMRSLEQGSLLVFLSHHRFMVGRSSCVFRYSLHVSLFFACHANSFNNRKLLNNFCKKAFPSFVLLWEGGSLKHKLSNKQKITTFPPT